MTDEFQNVRLVNKDFETQLKDSSSSIEYKYKVFEETQIRSVRMKQSYRCLNYLQAS